MTQRNGQNPIKSLKNFEHGRSHFNNPGNIHGNPQNPTGICTACGAEVPHKPGFRFSALKCPKCGASMRQQTH
ncbi:MAG: hypothetical protein A3G34_04950 [Candidatus Lindowbacteria bacterium RIFCSPLOWO2_12_FULL_62_27]|nr:MAG: hypothetical protein A3G34_04950 [Candidatus Lindowbacteria bacterium RIFCSPLOWO2_12_FULL_62_27]OGH62084.1 MAG: hypothetical protein A3I06_02495 [Candidatus Lindowbacteria bacterium RIFCSPLOWO2_02_FULL_62_12]